MNTSKLQPYLCFDGNCREAMSFYHGVLGGNLDLSTFGQFDSPEMPVPADQKDKIMHAMLDNGLLTMMASDNMPGQKINFGDSVSLSIAGEDEVQLTVFFKGLSEGGEVRMPLQKQVWGDIFGMFTDKYGIHWMINITAHKAG
jgi:PhnB protein